MFGGRLILLEHRGRTTGARRYAVLEVIGRPSPTRYLVLSGFGDRAQWYRSVLADPTVHVTRGSHRPVAATARVLDDVDARAALPQYVIRHRRAWETLRPVLERACGAPVDPSAASTPPVVALDLEAGPVRLGARLGDAAARPSARPAGPDRRPDHGSR